MLPVALTICAGFQATKSTHQLEAKRQSSLQFCFIFSLKTQTRQKHNVQKEYRLLNGLDGANQPLVVLEQDLSVQLIQRRKKPHHAFQTFSKCNRSRINIRQNIKNNVRKFHHQYRILLHMSQWGMITMKILDKILQHSKITRMTVMNSGMNLLRHCWRSVSQQAGKSVLFTTNYQPA